MTFSGSNINIGIDAGSSLSKLAYSDNLSTRIIAQTEGLNLLALREGAEAFFDDMILACVIAIPETFTSIQRENVIVQAKSSGFQEVNIITAHEALTLALKLDDNEKVLVYDFGASKSEFVILEGEKVLDSVNIPDVCGNKFDEIFAEYLRERKLLKENPISEARRIKIVLSQESSRMWHNTEILRDDFERLIYFTVKRALHIMERLQRVHKPKRIILTGGCANIPLVRKILIDEFGITPEIDFNIIVRGASLKAFSLSREALRNKEIVNISAGLKKIRNELIALEDKLTRSQKDRLYLLLKQAEGINDAGIINLMENMLDEIREA